MSDQTQTTGGVTFGELHPAASGFCREFWDDEQPAVRGVIELANLDVGQRRILCEAFLPQHVDAVERLASLLTFIHRVTWDDPRRILSDYYGYDVGQPSLPLDVLADAFADDRQFNVLTQAAVLAAALPMKAAA